MTIKFAPAKRENVWLLLGFAGGTGSGKTYTAMSVATGLSAGKRFAVIDTEAGRARHYADRFEFDVADLRPPFRPDAYADAIRSAAAAGYQVIVVDSMSHEWAGEGGILDWQEEELDRMAGDDWKKREAVKMAAWIRPKMAHKKFMQTLTQVRAHVILCFRAEEKIEMVRANGRTVIQPKHSLTGLDGWVPVCEKNLPFELTASFLLHSSDPGVGRPIKLQEQHRHMMPQDGPLTADFGRLIGEWARGVVDVIAANEKPSTDRKEASRMTREQKIEYLVRALKYHGKTDEDIAEFLGHPPEGSDEDEIVEMKGWLEVVKAGAATPPAP